MEHCICVYKVCLVLFNTVPLGLYKCYMIYDICSTWFLDIGMYQRVHTTNNTSSSAITVTASFI